MQTMPEEAIVMLCMSKKQVVQNPDTFIYPGSTEAVCNDCGEVVFASPATQTAIKKHSVTLLCPKCFLRRVRSEKEEPEFSALPETAREVNLWRYRRQ